MLLRSLEDNEPYGSKQYKDSTEDRKCFAQNHSEFQTLRNKIQSKTTCKYCIIDKGKKKERNA